MIWKLVRTEHPIEYCETYIFRCIIRSKCVHRWIGTFGVFPLFRKSLTDARIYLLRYDVKNSKDVSCDVITLRDTGEQRIVDDAYDGNVHQLDEDCKMTSQCRAITSGVSTLGALPSPRSDACYGNWRTTKNCRPAVQRIMNQYFTIAVNCCSQFNTVFCYSILNIITARWWSQVVGCLAMSKNTRWHLLASPRFSAQAPHSNLLRMIDAAQWIKSVWMIYFCFLFTRTCIHFDVQKTS